MHLQFTLGIRSHFIVLNSFKHHNSHSENHYYQYNWKQHIQLTTTNATLSVIEIVHIVYGINILLN